jgi:hypothetical protein
MGEEIVIARAGTPIARLVPFREKGARSRDRPKGLSLWAPDFDAPLPEDLQNPEDFIFEQVAQNGFEIFPIHLAHALKTYSLPRHDGDPFDRILVAQAAVEGLTLLSVDQRLAAYRVGLIW